MRHVSRTHRVALDWLFDKINLDPQIQIKYVDTKHQLADMLTEWKFHTWWVEQSSSFVQYQPYFSSTCCTKNFSLTSCSTMAKRIQEQKEENELCPSRDLKRWICLLILLWQVPPPHRVRLHLKVRWNPTAGWALIQTPSTQHRHLKCN